MLIKLILTVYGKNIILLSTCIIVYIKHRHSLQLKFAPYKNASEVDIKSLR